MVKRLEDMESLFRMKGVTAYTMAPPAGLTRQGIWKLLKGDADCFTDTLVAIAEALGVPAERVFKAFRQTRKKHARAVALV